MMNSMAIQLFLLSFVLVTFSCNPGSNSVQHKELSKDQSGLRWLTDIITWITWLLRSILSVVYFIIYTIVLTLTYFMATLFSLLHQFIKLIEFLWYLVRLVLQASHNFVSSCFYNTRMRSIVQNSYIFLKDLLVSTARTFLSLMKMILDFLLHIVFNMPKVLKVVIDLLYTVILWCGHLLLFIGKNIISLAFKISQNMMHLFQRIWAAIKTFGPIIFTYTKSLFYGVLQFIQAIFPIFYNVIMSILKTIGLLVGHCGRFVLNTFIALARFVYNMARTIIDMGTQLIQSIKASKTSVISMSCMLLLITTITMVLKINIFILGFGLFESLIQYVTLMIRSVNNQQTVIDNSRQSSNSTPGNEESLKHQLELERAIDKSRQSSNSTLPGNEESLQRQLELERDKTLCVVCQDEVKKILLLPCRHMCTCVVCANHITSNEDWEKRACPLCRTQVKSTIEVYS